MARTKAQRDGLALLGYACLTALFTYPLVAQLGTRVGGSGDDPFIFLWNNWWTKQVLATGASPYWSPYLYFPNGASLVFHSFSWTNSLLALAIEPFAGPIVSYNLVLMSGYALTGWGTYLLSSYLTERAGAAFVAGAVCAFAPYRITQASHPLFVSIGWMPLALLFLIRCVREGRARHAVLAGVCTALVGLTAWHLLILATAAFALVLGHLFLAEREHVSRGSIRLIALAGLLAATLMMPALAPLLRVQFGGDADEEIYVRQDERTQTDLLAYVVPNRLQPVYGGLFTTFYDRFQKNRNYIAFLGYSVLALGVLGAWKSRRAALPWVLLAAFYGLMALGPILRFNGRLYPGVPMPYRLIGWTPFVRLLKQPDRFNLVLGLPVGVLVGYGLGWLHQRWDARLGQRWAWAVWAVCGMVIAFEYVSIPMWTIGADYPAVVDRLCETEAQTAVLDIPMGRAVDKRYLYHQTVHGMPIVGGHISRPLAGTYRFIEAHPLLKTIHDGTSLTMSDEELANEMHALADNDVSFIVLHKGRTSEELEINWGERLSPWTIEEDSSTILFGTGGAGVSGGS